MKILILVIITTWSFAGGYHGKPPFSKMVHSVEEAALVIYEDQKYLESQIEPDQKEYKLYEVDVDKKTIKEISIPKVKFEYPKELTTYPNH